MKGTVSIIIPVYNEEKYIKKTIQEVLQSNTLGLKKEIIVINDGSTDKTSIKIKFFRLKIKTINGKTNQGKGSAIRAGLMIAKGDILIIQDADLEYSPSDYPALLEPFRNKKVNVIFGSRILGRAKFHNSYSGILFYLGGQILTKLINFIYGTNLTDQPTGYKVFRRKFINLLTKKSKEKGFAYEVEMTALLAKNKINIIEVPISYNPRHIEEGKKINIFDFLISIFVALKHSFIK